MAQRFCGEYRVGSSFCSANPTLDDLLAARDDVAGIVNSMNNSMMLVVSKKAQD